uniref:Gypsy retrotransposon integrase-like protein 1 n=1 Tax=Tanacetum cinerariifolium TaxID=118510 RepID=A0A6L2JE80_TANCI|nr:gypsy retrotransposon integrase-like protein 1 [Tanacetum cinerariifolium]
MKDLGQDMYQYIPRKRIFLLEEWSLLKEHNGRGNVSPIHLSFDDVKDQTRVWTVVTGKEIGDADLKRPFKEAVKTPLTRRIIEFAGLEFKMPANIKLYDGTTDPKDHLSRFSSAANSGKWPMPVWCHQTEITKIVRKANETLVDFKERWVETGFITGVLEVMKISSFMDAHKCPELAKRYSDKVPKTVDEIMTRLDDFVRSKEAFVNTKLPKEKRQRQRGRGNTNERNAGKDKIINMIRSWPDDKKQKSVERDESWMKTPIVFPPFSMEDTSDEVTVEMYPNGLGRFHRGSGEADGKDRVRETGQNTLREEEGQERLGLTEQTLVNPTYPDQLVMIGGNLSEGCNDQLKTLLKKSMDVFVQELADMTGITRRVIEHSLNVNPSIKPVAQKRRVMASDRTQEVIKEVGEWMNAGIVRPEEMMYMYLAAATEAVSTVLLTERNGKKCSIHYVSRTLNEAKRNYAPLEKLAPSLLHMSRRLRRYFEAHPIKVISDQPQENTKKAQASGKLAKYSVELRAYNISYEPRNAIKGQFLADFLSEALVGTPPEEFFRMPVEMQNKDDIKQWTLFIDGASNNKGSGSGLVLISPSGRLEIGGESDQRKLRGKQHQHDQIPSHEERMQRWVQKFSYPKHTQELKPEGQHFKSVAERQGGKKGPENVNKSVYPRGRRPKLMTSIMASWPFYQWGMDILGPLPQASQKLKFVIVAIDYFTKCIEAKPLARITGKDVKKFIWDNIVRRFRLSVLTYGSEAVIPTEIGMPTHRTMMIRKDENEDELRLNMDLLQERREAAAIREAKYKTKMEQYYNQKVSLMSFKPNKYVYRMNEASKVEDQGKLGLKWKEPYRVTEAYQNGSYKLQTMRGKEVPQTWHVMNLKKCYE